MNIRILLVDDYEDWRNRVRSLLQARPEWEIISEASDGLEAVQKAEEFKPDVILLDIGLPTLNGIEVARQIRRLSPNSKIVFLSLENSLNVVQEALSTGAQSYVHKLRIHLDLLPAIDAALRGPDASRRHEVLFYSDDTVLMDRLTRVVVSALRSGNAAFVLATKSHRDRLLQRLEEQRVDVEHAIRQGTYISLDAADTLSRIMVSDLPDATRFFDSIGGVIESAARATRAVQPRVAAFGEAVALLQAEGNSDAAIRLEQLWNRLVETYQVDILCGYASASFHGEEDEDVYERICATHSAILRI